jgi:hypothetical protein
VAVTVKHRKPVGQAVQRWAWASSAQPGDAGLTAPEIRTNIGAGQPRCGVFPAACQFPVLQNGGCLLPLLLFVSYAWPQLPCCCLYHMHGSAGCFGRKNFSENC